MRTRKPKFLRSSYLEALQRNARPSGGPNNFLVCSLQSLFMEQTVVRLSLCLRRRRRRRLFICQYRGCTHRLFCRSRSLFILRSCSLRPPPSFLFIFPSSRLLHPLLFSSLSAAPLHTRMSGRNPPSSSTESLANGALGVFPEVMTI